VINTALRIELWESLFSLLYIYRASLPACCMHSGDLCIHGMCAVVFVFIEFNPAWIDGIATL